MHDNEEYHVALNTVQCTDQQLCYKPLDVGPLRCLIPFPRVVCPFTSADIANVALPESTRWLLPTTSGVATLLLFNIEGLWVWAIILVLLAAVVDVVLASITVCCTVGGGDGADDFLLFWSSMSFYKHNDKHDKTTTACPYQRLHPRLPSNNP